MSKETREQLQAHVDELQGRNAGLSREVARRNRALAAGSRRYNREQHRARQAQERILQQANHRAEQLELAGQEQALLQLQAVQEAHEARKLAAGAQRRADKLAAKLVHRAGELGRMRRVYADMFAGRTRALEDAGKRTAGLKASLREAKDQIEAWRHRAERAEQQVDTLRQKLRDANRSVIMGALGGGLEIQPQPLSGRQHEDTTGYTPAALRAVKGGIQ